MNERTKLLTVALSGLLLAVVAVVIIASRGGDGESELPPASGAVQPVTKDITLEKPGQMIEPGDTASVTMKTSEGSFTIALEPDRAPVTVNNFAYLTEKGFFDGLGFHRIVPGFVIQGGDPDGSGAGGPGYQVTETPPADLEYRPGVVAMAKSEDEAPGTSGSQFFVVTGPNGSGLPPEYALVGTVSEGMNVVENIGEMGGADEQPTRTVVIEKATLNRG